MLTLMYLQHYLLYWESINNLNIESEKTCLNKLWSSDTQKALPLLELRCRIFNNIGKSSPNTLTVKAGYKSVLMSAPTLLTSIIPRKFSKGLRSLLIWKILLQHIWIKKLKALSTLCQQWYFLCFCSLSGTEWPSGSFFFLVVSVYLFA